MRDFLKNKLSVPENWDKFDYQTQRYSFEDIEEIFQTYKDEQLRKDVVGSSMVKVCGNTTSKEYAGFTDQIIAIRKNGQTVVLEPEDLRKLEHVVGGKFRR